MKGRNTILRAAALAAAALILPCCRDQVGQGDSLSMVTVRASLTLLGVQPNQDCSEVHLSASGRFVAWSSASDTLTSNDDNGLVDIFLRDRLSGQIVNVTKVDLFGEFPPFAPADCFNPSVSSDGRYILFRSKGGWVPYTAPASTTANFLLYRFDRANKVFQKAFVDGTPGVAPNSDLNSPTMSSDGRYVAFQSSATNLAPPNGSGFAQIYVHDMQTGVTVIASRAKSPAALNAPCSGDCMNPRISPDGLSVAFESNALNLDGTYSAGPTPQVYVGTAAGAYPAMVARNSGGAAATGRSFLPCISEGGQHVVFLSYDTALAPGAVPNPGLPILVRRTLPGGPTELVADKTAQIPFLVFLNGYASSVSADGRMVAFLSRENPSFRAQVLIRDMASGAFLASQHQNGSLSNIDCDPPAIDAVGDWVGWTTKGSTLVDGDTNGVSDVFLRGPLR